MRILVLSTYPPKPCGIGRYAHQLVRRMRSEGYHVDVMSVDGLGDVDYRLDLSRPLDALRAWWIARRYDQVLVNYSPVLIPLSGSLARRRLRLYSFHLLLYFLFRLAPKVDVRLILHEFSRPVTAFQRAVFGRFWRAAPLLLFHSEPERFELLRSYPGVSLARTGITSPHEHYVSCYAGTRAEARRRLGLPQDQLVFLSCGFIHPGKGFDVPASLFAHCEAIHPDAHFYMVGALNSSEASFRDYLASLEALAASSPRVHVVEGFLDDETFDAWIVAADYVVVSYRPTFAWSSSIVGRARILGTRVVATRVGAIEHQDVDLLVEDAAELEQALIRLSTEKPANG